MDRIRNVICVLCGVMWMWGALSIFAADSNSIFIDLRETCVVTGGAVYLSPSSGVPSALPKVDGSVASGWSVGNPRWDSVSVEDGWHTLSVAGESATPKVLSLNSDDTIIHDGVLNVDESWPASKLHVVRGWVRIPQGRRLTIASGAIVKFCTRTGIIVEGTLQADGAVFTALADDNVGGDTDHNGKNTVAQTTYTISGAGSIFNTGTQYRFYYSQPWSAPTDMQNSMSVSLVVLRADGMKMDEPGSIVGFFDGNGKCRGTALLRPTAWGAWVFQGQVFSNESSEKGWTIKVWNAATNTISTAVETLDFVQDSTWGTARSPKEIRAAHHVFLDGVDKGWFDVSQAVTMAAAVPRRKVFDVWTTEGISLTQQQKTSNPLIFSMPDNDVKLYSSFMYPNYLTWTLAKGWNWVSVNLSPNADITYVLREYAPSDGDQIKTSDCFSTYYSKYGCWEPEIPIVAGRMYAFYRNNSGTTTVKIRGDLLEADNDITLSKGWNWIGCFTDASSIDREALVHSNGFSDGDQLKGHGGSDFADYYDFEGWTGWDGALENMVAGRGYKLKVARAGILSVSRNQTRGMADVAWETRSGGSEVGVSGPWAPPEGYAFSMTLEAEVKNQSGEKQTAPGSVIGIFDGQGNCRGIATLRTTKWNTQVYGGQVMSDNATETGLCLRFWDADTGNIQNIQEKVDFAQDTAYGTAVSPKMFTLTGTIPTGSYRLTVNGKQTAGYCAGDAIRVCIPTTPAGYRFLRWTANGVVLADATAPIQNFTMPAKDVVLTVSYAPLGFQGPDGWNMPEGSSLPMTVFGTVLLVTDEFADEPDSMVAAFDDNGVCRGVGVPDAYMSAQYGCSVYLLQVASDGQTKGLSLKYWSQSEGTTQDLEETLDVVAGTVVGDTRPVAWNVVYVEPDWKYVTLELEPGWNLVSPTLKLTKESITALMEYSPRILVNENFSSATSKDILPGRGLWFYNLHTDTQELMLKGLAVENWQLEVVPGWQMIGAVKAVSTKEMPANVEDIMEWKPTEGYRRVQSLVPGAAYWVKGR